MVDDIHPSSPPGAKELAQAAQGHLLVDQRRAACPARENVGSPAEPYIIAMLVYVAGHSRLRSRSEGLENLSSEGMHTRM